MIPSLLRDFLNDLQSQQEIDEIRAWLDEGPLQANQELSDLLANLTAEENAQLVGEWKPGDDLCFVFDDQTADARTEQELDALKEALRASANRFDFDISQYGTRLNMARFFERFYNADGTIKET